MHVRPAYRQVASVSEMQAEWSRLRPEIIKAIPFMGGTHDERDLLAAVGSGEFTFWVAPKAFVLAALEKFPRLTRVSYFLGGGDLAQTDHLVPLIEAWGLQNGASKIVCTARPAVERHNLKRPTERIETGWTRTGAVYTKDLI